jgi:hypothetical protein
MRDASRARHDGDSVREESVSVFIARIGRPALYPGYGRRREALCVRQCSAGLRLNKGARAICIVLQTARVPLRETTVRYAFSARSQPKDIARRAWRASCMLSQISKPLKQRGPTAAHNDENFDNRET